MERTTVMTTDHDNIRAATERTIRRSRRRQRYQRYA